MSRALLRDVAGRRADGAQDLQAVLRRDGARGHLPRCRQEDAEHHQCAYPEPQARASNRPSNHLTRQAPVSLAGSLEEYLRDPNFEKNRAEYQESKRIADGRPAAAPSKSPAPVPAASADKSSAAKPVTPPAQTSATIHDFFASIESEQPTMFNPNTGSPTTAYFQAQAQYNPFAQRAVLFGQPNAFGQFLQPQPTGAFAMAPQPTGAFAMAPQSTGFVQPQPTGPFAMPQQGYMQAQPTGAFAQPQQPSAFLSVRHRRWLS